MAISLTEGVEYQTIEAGEVLFKEGEPVPSFYLVSSGKIALAKIVESRIVFVGLAEGGELVAEDTVMGGYQRHLYGAVALERSEVCALPRTEALSVVQSKSDWVQNILKNMSEKLENTLRLLAEHKIDDARLGGELSDEQTARVRSALLG